MIDEFTVKEIIEFHRNLFLNFKDYKNNFGIDLLMNKKVSKLSMGEKQKVGIYLALSSDSDILLLDEPLAGVDTNTKKTIVTEIKKISKNKLVILASHQSFNYGSAKVLSIIDGEIEENILDIKI